MGCDPPCYIERGEILSLVHVVCRRRWFISHYDFIMGCDPPSATRWFKKYKVVHLPLWIQNGVWPPLLQQGGSINKVVHFPLWIQNRVWPPFWNRVVQKYKVVNLQVWFQNGVWPPLFEEWRKERRGGHTSFWNHSLEILSLAQVICRWLTSHWFLE